MNGMLIKVCFLAVMCLCLSPAQALAQRTVSQCPISEDEAAEGVRAVVGVMLSSSEFGSLAAPQAPIVQMENTYVQTEADRPVEAYIAFDIEQLSRFAALQLIESGQARVFHRGANAAANRIDLHMIVSASCSWGLTLRLNAPGGARLGEWSVRRGN